MGIIIRSTIFYQKNNFLVLIFYKVVQTLNSKCTNHKNFSKLPILYEKYKNSKEKNLLPECTTFKNEIRLLKKI